MPNYWVLRRDDATDSYHHIEGPEDTPYRLSFLGADGADANGLAAIKSGTQGQFVAFRLDSAELPTVTNTTTQLTADSQARTNADL